MKRSPRFAGTLVAFVPLFMLFLCEQAFSQEFREEPGTPLPAYAKVLVPRPGDATPRDTVDLVENGLPNIMITGYWPPTNEMIRRFSNNIVQNPDGWIGENWEDRGYNIYAFFPEFPDGVGKGVGDFEVDYQDTSSDWWRIVAEVQPVALITFSRSAPDNSWIIEGGNRNYALNGWADDYLAPLKPTPELPIASELPGRERDSSLPLQLIFDAVTASAANVSPIITDIDESNFLSNYIGYHGNWYKTLHAGLDDPTPCVGGGHIHVGYGMDLADAVLATEVTLRTYLPVVDQRLFVRGDLNCDYKVTIDDIVPFVSALLDPDAFELASPYCGIERADMDNDGHVDGRDLQGFIDALRPDCNNNGIPDDREIALGLVPDCNGNGVPDSCDLADEYDTDCNSNGIPDACDIAAGAPDANSNGLPDECDDVTPPTPNPMTWEIPPAANGLTSIIMTATEAVDPQGVQYLFASGSGASLSVWRTDRTFIHSGLNKNFPYSYKVKARDESPAHNETAFSASVWAASAIETPTGLSVTNVTQTSMTLTAQGTFTNLNFGSSGLYFEMTPDVPGSGANVWITGTTSKTINVTGLTPETEYVLRVKARNYFGLDETPFTAPVVETTLAP